MVTVTGFKGDPVVKSEKSAGVLLRFTVTKDCESEKGVAVALAVNLAQDGAAPGAREPEAAGVDPTGAGPWGLGALQGGKSKGACRLRIEFSLPSRPTATTPYAEISLAGATKSMRCPLNQKFGDDWSSVVVPIRKRKTWM